MAALGWVKPYLRRAMIVDGACALAAGAAALELRFQSQGHLPPPYLAATLALPACWLAVVALAGGYDRRVIGVGSEEFRRVLSAAASLTAGLAVMSYALKLDFARGYMILALPGTTMLDLIARHRLRKGLHRRRGRGACMHRTVVVGHTPAVADMVGLLRRDRHHGLAVVAACVAGASGPTEIAGVPVLGDLDGVSAAVDSCGADTVAVLASPELDGIRLRRLAWELEKAGAHLCVAPTLLAVAGPRTTIRPVAGLPLLHLDHPELAGGKRLVKGVFDRAAAVLALIVLAPVMAVIALAIRLSDRGPAFSRQTRVGKDGRIFRMVRFRTTAAALAEAESREEEAESPEKASGRPAAGREDPRATRLGGWLRRRSLDGLPQLFNVLTGDMSLVGPRAAPPWDVARRGGHTLRTLVAKPGVTGLWQVCGAAEPSPDHAMLADLRYVENWSLALDLQILRKTIFVFLRRAVAS